MAIAPLIVGIRTRGVAALGAAGAAFRRFGNNVRQASNRAQNSFIASGGLLGALNRLGQRANRLGTVFARAGRQAGQFFVDNFATIAKSGMAVAAAPIAATLVAGLLAALGAAVLLAAGGGILAAGIAVAVKDPAVKAAFGGLGDRAKEAFKGFGTPFKAPLIRAASTFGDTVEKLGPAFKRMGTMMAPLIDKLAPAFAEMAEKAMPGIEEAVRASIPLFEKLAEHAPKIGEAISKFFSKVADAGPEITRVFDAILSAVEFLIEGLGSLINWGAKFYDTMIGFWTGVKDFAVSSFAVVTSVVLGAFGMIINGAARAFGWVPGIGDKLKGAAEEFNKFAAKVNRALDDIQDENVTITYRANWVGNHLMSGSQLSGNYSSGIGGRAAGGPVTAGQPYIVGEKRPELFVPNQSGYIQPFVPSAARMGGSGSGAAAAGGGRMVLEARGTGGVAQLIAYLIRAGDLRLTVNNGAVRVA